MNRTDLRLTTGQLAEKAKLAKGRPSKAVIAEARRLFHNRKEFLSDLVQSNLEVKYCPEPDWKSWRTIAEFFGRFHAALVEIDNRLSRPLAEERLRGV